MKLNNNAKGALGLLLCSAGIGEARHVPERPDIQASPFPPYKPFPTSTPREKTCFVKPSCTEGGDDAPKILAAMEECNNGGTIVLDKHYRVCSPLDLRFLKHVDVALTGTIKFCDDLDYWQPNFFYFHFQDAASWWVWGGEDINLYGAGTGTIDGSGQAWWEEFAVNSTVHRPLLFITDGWHGGSITGIKYRQSPNWHNFIANSSDILISDIDILSRSETATHAGNLDGWDTFRSDNIVIQNSVVNHDDDCVSFKPNSTNIIVQGLRCNGSHGISVGSLGNYPEQYDIVENLYIYNNTLSNSTTAARLKVWPGAEAVKKSNWVGGGGKGYVRNVTYELFHSDNNGHAIQIDQCYGAINASECEDHPSEVILTDVIFKDFWGTSNGDSDPVVGSLICGSEESCDNIRAENVSMTLPSGKEPKWSCRNMDLEFMDLNGAGCVDA